MFQTHEDQRDPDSRMFKVRAVLHEGKHSLSFDLLGDKDSTENLVPEILGEIQAGLDLVRSKVNPEDLVEEED